MCANQQKHQVVSITLDSESEPTGTVSQMEHGMALSDDEESSALLFDGVQDSGSFIHYHFAFNFNDNYSPTQQYHRTCGQPCLKPQLQVNLTPPIRSQSPR
jgi:hypothetical protein